MNQEYESNYEKVFSYFQGEFLKLAQEAAAEKLGLFCEEDAIMIPWFGNCWRIDRNTGIITDENGNIPDVTQRLLIMHHFCFFRMDAVHSDKWVPFRQIREAACFERAYKKSAVDPIVEYFAGKTELFAQAARALGGTPVPYGDAGFRIYPLPQIGLTYIFYDADEEFEASCNILFESTVTWWIHPESVPTIASAATEKLIATAERMDTAEQKATAERMDTAVQKATTERTDAVGQKEATEQADAAGKKEKAEQMDTPN